MPVARLADFESTGIFYAATEVEARYCRDCPVVVVIGCGNAARFLSRHAHHVHVLARGTSLAAFMAT